MCQDLTGLSGGGKIKCNMLGLRHKQQGFTIVELLMVIVIIGVLVAVSIVAYNGVNKKANSSSLESNLSQAARKLEALKATDGVFPSDLSSSGLADIASFGYWTSSNQVNYCLSSKKGDIVREISSSNPTPREGICAGALFRWSVSGGVSYDELRDQLVLTHNINGIARSPLFLLDGKTVQMTMALESFATIPRAGGAGDTAQVYSGAAYFATNGVTPVYNSAGWTSNGNARELPLNSWENYSWSISTGSNVQNASFNINSDATRTSNNIIRNVRITYK